MKLIPGAFVLALVMTAAAPHAEARMCAQGGRHLHCAAPLRVGQNRHARCIWRSRETGAITAAPCPDADYIPYERFYPPMPAAIFDLPPERDFLN